MARKKQIKVPTFTRPHRDLCAKYAAWLTREQAWVEAATYETRLPWKRRTNGSVADVLAIRTNWTTRKQKNRALICEIKVSRADLLSDLRERKMHKYAQWGQCTLVVNHTASRFPALGKKGVLDDLRQRGFPDEWGVVLVPDGWNGRDAPVTLRRPARCPVLTDAHMQKLVAKMIRSLSYKCLRGAETL